MSVARDYRLSILHLVNVVVIVQRDGRDKGKGKRELCLLYTSDAADE